MNSFMCPVCQQPCALIARSDILDGKTWYCKMCKNKKSICHGSFLERSHLSFHQMILIIYGWARD